jgi:hypothetical protein
MVVPGCQRGIGTLRSVLALALLVVLPLPVEALSERLAAQRLVALSVTRSAKVKSSPNGYTNLRPSIKFCVSFNFVQLQWKRLGGKDLA